MYQAGIVPVDQGVYLLNAETSQVIHKFIDELSPEQMNHSFDFLRKVEESSSIPLTQVYKRVGESLALRLKRKQLGAPL